MSKSDELKARKAAAVPAGVGSRGIYVAKAENSELWDVDGRRLHRFCRGHRRAQHRPPPPASHGGRGAAGQAFAHTCFHVAPYESYVRLAERLNALAPGDFAKKTLFLNSGRRGGRKRHQDRALLHQALRRDRLFRRLPRPHAHDHGAHRQGHAVQARLRSVSGRGLSRRISPALSRHHDGAGARRLGSAVSRRRRSEVGRGHHHRAGARRGRLQRRARRFPARAAPAMR